MTAIPDFCVHSGSIFLYYHDPGDPGDPLFLVLKVLLEIWPLCTLSIFSTHLGCGWHCARNPDSSAKALDTTTSTTTLSCISSMKDVVQIKHYFKVVVVVVLPTELHFYLKVLPEDVKITNMQKWGVSHFADMQIHARTGKGQIKIITAGFVTTTCPDNA